MLHQLHLTKSEQAQQIERLSAQVLSLSKENKDIMDSIKDLQGRLDSEATSQMSFSQVSAMDNMGALIE